MHLILLILLLSILIIPSCSNTSAFVSGVSLDNTLTVEEKLIASNAIPINLDGITPIFSGDEWLSRLMELTEGAEDYILISTFLGSSSSALEPFYELLCEKAESGVDVYFMMDGSSSYDMTESKFYMTPLYFLRERGVHLVEINPYTLSHVIAPHTLLNRDHRKMFVIDGKVAALGGMNLNYISLGGEGASQRDSMYLFDSSTLISTLVDQFVNTWNEESVIKIDRSRFSTFGSTDGDIKAYLFNQGVGGNATVSSMYASLLNSAKEEILFLPYMPVLDGNMKRSLRDAKDRGVDITLVAAMDRSYVKEGISYDIEELFDLSNALYVAQSNKKEGVLNLHEKLMIVDERYTVIGSSNFNMRSMGMNAEIALVIDSKEFAKTEKEHFYSRLSEGAQYITKEDAKRIKEEDGSLFSYLFTYLGG